MDKLQLLGMGTRNHSMYNQDFGEVTCFQFPGERKYELVGADVLTFYLKL